MAENGGDEASDESDCEWEIREDLGPVCDLGDLLKVRHSDGSIGYTHGTDPVPESPKPTSGLSSTASQVPPACAQDFDDEYYSVFIYARAHDDDDRYASLQDDLRALVEETNGLLRAEAAEFNHVVDYRFRCDDAGDVRIFEEVLPTDMADADFSSIVGDIRDKGYDRPNVKYWIWYDDRGACSCGGTGHIFGDDRLTVDNWNNGRVAMYGVTFGYLSVRIAMHENGHNLGAVQASAPDSSEGWHCNDGQDIMCYSDGGPNSSYDPNVCADTHFDCDHDTYFHPAPPAGSYLAKHWNLGDPLNRLLNFGGNQAPTVQSIDCTPATPENGEEVTCTFSATDDSTDIHYEIDWGDDSGIDRVPDQGKVASGTELSASHIWTESGTRTVEVDAVDDAVTPRTGNDTLDVDVLDVPCTLQRSGLLLAGVAGFPRGLANATETIPHECRAHPFELSADPFVNDVDVCFYDEDVELDCYRALFGEDGEIPKRTTRAEIELFAGAAATYELVGFDP